MPEWGVDFLKVDGVTIDSVPDIQAVSQAIDQSGRAIGGVTYAAVYNLGSSSTNITVDWSALGLSGTKAVRDLVARADLGSFNGSWTATNVPAHGSRLIKIS